MRIDAHQHFWDIQRFQYPWMPAGDSPLRHNFLPRQLAPILERNNFHGSVMVQANTIIEDSLGDASTVSELAPHKPSAPPEWHRSSDPWRAVD